MFLTMSATSRTFEVDGGGWGGGAETNLEFHLLLFGQWLNSHIIEQGWGGWRAARFSLLFSFPCSANHERDWPPCKVVFFGLPTNTLNVRNNNSNKLMMSNI